jgi:hypothetical protein
VTSASESGPLRSKTDQAWTVLRLRRDDVRRRSDVALDERQPAIDKHASCGLAMER